MQKQPQPKEEQPALHQLNSSVRAEEKAISDAVTSCYRAVIRDVFEQSLKEKFEVKIVKLLGSVYRRLAKDKTFQQCAKENNAVLGNVKKKRKASAIIECKTKKKNKHEGVQDTKETKEKKVLSDTDTDGEDLNDTAAEDAAELKGQTNDHNYKADPDATEEDTNWIVDDDEEAEKEDQEKEQGEKQDEKQEEEQDEEQNDNPPSSKQNEEQEEGKTNNDLQQQPQPQPQQQSHNNQQHDDLNNTSSSISKETEDELFANLGQEF